MLSNAPLKSSDRMHTGVWVISASAMVFLMAEMAPNILLSWTPQC